MCVRHFVSKLFLHSVLLIKNLFSHKYSSLTYLQFPILDVCVGVCVCLFKVVKKNEINVKIIRMDVHAELHGDDEVKLVKPKKEK